MHLLHLQPIATFSNNFGFRFLPRGRLIEMEPAVGDVACGAGGFAFGSCELSIGVVEFAEEGRGGVVEDVEGWWHGLGRGVGVW